MKCPRKTRPAPWLAAAGRKTQRRSKRARELEQYRKRALEVVTEAQKWKIRCPVSWELRRAFRLVSEIHHYKGRVGSLLLDERFWLLVSRWGHRWIHDNPEKARREKWLCQKGEWGKQES